MFNNYDVSKDMKTFKDLVVVHRVSRNVGTVTHMDVVGYTRYNKSYKLGQTGLIMHHKDGVTPVTKSTLLEFDFMLPLSWTKEKIISELQPLMEINQFVLIRLKKGLKLVDKTGNNLYIVCKI